MSRSIDDLINDLNRVEARLRELLPDVAIVLTLSAKAISERTIKDKGFGRKYSETTYPAWFLHGKELNKKGEQFIKEKEKKKELTNWKALRIAQGLQVDHVDYTYTGSTFRNMGPAPVEVRDAVFSAPLAATNVEAQNKMNWGRDRYGDFIGAALTPEDFKNLQQIVINEIMKVLNEVLL